MSYTLDESMADFGKFFNLEQATTPSQAQAQQGKTVVSPQPTRGQENIFIQQQTQPTYHGPSHQYDLFPQHTPFAPGAYAIQQARQLSPQKYGANVPSLEYTEADGSSFGGMDMDFPDMFESTGLVDPSSLGVGSEEGDVSPVVQPVQRLWPGMHQQHAAAKEQQKKLQEQQRLQQQQRIAVAQQELGTPAPASHQRRPSQGRNKPSDPAMEERISQILRSMRQNNSRPDSSGTPPPGTSHPSKQKKDEEDMDEDERLLASEEGKKLSSKERRQLRNKVSARAFRSRRKEYISQLEGELQAKTQEADELQFDNDSLRNENAQLTDLARMLLSQPAFQNVLEDFAARGSQMPHVSSQNVPHRGSIQQTVQTPISAPTSQQQTVTTPMDFSTPMDGWTSSITAPDFNFNLNVFAVTEVPDPIIETDVLSGKLSRPSFLPGLPVESAKQDHPVVERPTKADSPSVGSPSEFDSDDIFAIPTCLSTENWSPTLEARGESTTTLSLGKSAIPQFELVSVEQAEREHEMLESRFATLCERLDSACLRIDSIISRR